MVLGEGKLLTFFSVVLIHAFLRCIPKGLTDSFYNTAFKIQYTDCETFYQLPFSFFIFFPKLLVNHPYYTYTITTYM